MHVNASAQPIDSLYESHLAEAMSKHFNSTLHQITSLTDLAVRIYFFCVDIARAQLGQVQWHESSCHQML